MQGEEFDKIICSVGKTLNITEILAKDFMEHGYYGSMFTVLFESSVLFESFIKALVSEVVSAYYKISEPINAY